MIPTIEKKQKITTQKILDQIHIMFFDDGLQEAIEAVTKVNGMHLDGEYYIELGKQIMVC